MALREILLFVVLRFFQILLILSAMFKGFLGIMFYSCQFEYDIGTFESHM